MMSLTTGKADKSDFIGRFGDFLVISLGPGRSCYVSPFIEGGKGDGELHLFGDKNSLHPTLLHPGGGENRMLLQRKAHSAIILLVEFRLKLTILIINVMM
jgi:hypothetical protein